MAYTEMDHYNDYVKSGDMRDRTKVLMALSPILAKKHKQLAGTLPDAAIKANIAKHAVSAIDSYDPTKGAKLSTHVFNHIAQASRLNYTYQNIVRMSEDKQQGKYKFYKKALDDLNAELNREPTEVELAQRLGWTNSEVKDLKASLFSDIFESRQEVEDERSNYSDDKIRMGYIMDNLSSEDKRFFNDKTSGMSQVDMSKKYGTDINRLNYKSRKLVDKIKSLQDNYDGI